MSPVIRFNRPFSAPIRAISFDLDDTLYQNHEVIQQAEQAQFDALCQITDQQLSQKIRQDGISFWQDLKWKLAKQDPDIRHDVTHWRRQILIQGLAEYGIAGEQNAEISEQVFAAFYQARSNFEVPKTTFSVLAALRDKFPLVAVTNGNADIQRLGLTPYFVGYYRAGEQGCKMKPYPDMLHLASQHLDIPTKNILHIGDNEESDVQAAHHAGCPSLWFNPLKQLFPSGYKLADAEFSDLEALRLLL